jgi:hypothetical protein
MTRGKLSRQFHVPSACCSGRLSSRSATPPAHSGAATVVS